MGKDKITYKVYIVCETESTDYRLQDSMACIWIESFDMNGRMTNEWTMMNEWQMNEQWWYGRTTNEWTMMNEWKNDKWMNEWSN